MLTTLKLSNYIFIDDLEIDWTNGMNVLTGETGSGKSLIIGAISILLGRKTTTNIIKKDANTCEITAIFELNTITTKKIAKIIDISDYEIDQEIILTKKITNDGKTKCYLNSKLVSMSILSKITSKLIDIHGQNTNLGIFESIEQLNILDNFAQTTELRNNIKNLFYEKKSLENQLENIILEKTKLKEKQELLKFQKDELEKLNLKQGEYEKLDEKYKYLANFEKIKLATTEANSSINILQTELAKFIKNFNKIIEYKPDYKNYSTELSEAENLFTEIIHEISSFDKSLDISEFELDEIANRLDKLNKAQKKYNKSNDELLKYFNELSNLIENIDSETEEEILLKQNLKELEKTLQILAKELTQKRKSASKNLEKAIKENFTELCMDKVDFKIEITELSEITKNGKDNIKFLIKTNPGQDFSELAKIISGGELSRIMLAIKNVLSEFDEIPTLIFDEIDTGIGGKIAFVVGKKLQTISKKHQLFCITHLAQVAVFGKNHKIVIKKPLQNETKIEILDLDEKQKINEIARMLGGEKITNTAIEHAKELMKNSWLN